MTRYYKYSADTGKGKYAEVSEDEFITQVMNVKGRFYIPMGDVVLECSEQEYREYRKETGTVILGRLKKRKKCLS